VEYLLVALVSERLVRVNKDVAKIFCLESDSGIDD
jgi:hypothetical protein